MACPHQQKRHVTNRKKTKQTTTTRQTTQRAISVHTAIAIAILYFWISFLLLFDLLSFPIFYDQSPATCCVCLKKRIQIFFFFSFIFFFFLYFGGGCRRYAEGKTNKIPVTLQITAATSGNHVTSGLLVFFNFPYFSELLEFFFFFNFSIMSAVETDRKRRRKSKLVEAKSSSAI